VPPVLEVPHTFDFAVNGRGDHEAWDRARPVPMLSRQVKKLDRAYKTWFKALWSERGVYFLIDCSDKKLTTTGLPDHGDLWIEDVVEVFLWPDENVPIYFEYCISPLAAEFPVLCPHLGAHYMPAFPYRYRDGRRVQKATSARGGMLEPGAVVKGWTAEFFIPRRLLYPLTNTRLRHGVEWRANVYRIDYDQGFQHHFCWNDVGDSFHNHKQFGKLVFV